MCVQCSAAWNMIICAKMYIYARERAEGENEIFLLNFILRRELIIGTKMCLCEDFLSIRHRISASLLQCSSLDFSSMWCVWLNYSLRLPRVRLGPGMIYRWLGPDEECGSVDIQYLTESVERVEIVFVATPITECITSRGAHTEGGPTSLCWENSKISTWRSQLRPRRNRIRMSKQDFSLKVIIHIPWR